MANDEDMVSADSPHAASFPPQFTDPSDYVLWEQVRCDEECPTEPHIYTIEGGSARHLLAMEPCGRCGESTGISASLWGMRVHLATYNETCA